MASSLPTVTDGTTRHNKESQAIVTQEVDEADLITTTVIEATAVMNRYHVKLHACYGI